MMKFFENRYIDHITKTLIVGLLGWVVWLMIDVRDTHKYIQPGIDAEQNRTIKGVYDRMTEVCDLQNEKNGVIHKRISMTDDKVNKTVEKMDKMDRKLDILIYHVTGRPVITDELTQK